MYLGEWMSAKPRLDWITFCACAISLGICYSPRCFAQTQILAEEGEQAIGQPPGVEYWSLPTPAIGRDGTISMGAAVGADSKGPLTSVGYLGQVGEWRGGVSP